MATPRNWQACRDITALLTAFHGGKATAAEGAELITAIASDHRRASALISVLIGMHYGAVEDEAAKLRVTVPQYLQALGRMAAAERLEP